MADFDVHVMKLPDMLKYFFFFKISTTRRDFICAATSRFKNYVVSPTHSREEMDDWIRLGMEAIVLSRNAQIEDHK